MLSYTHSHLSGSDWVTPFLPLPNNNQSHKKCQKDKNRIERMKEHKPQSYFYLWFCCNFVISTLLYKFTSYIIPKPFTICKHKTFDWTQWFYFEPPVFWKRYHYSTYSWRLSVMIKALSKYSDQWRAVCLSILQEKQECPAQENSRRARCCLRESRLGHGLSKVIIFCQYYFFSSYKKRSVSCEPIC